MLALSLSVGHKINITDDKRLVFSSSLRSAEPRRELVSVPTFDAMPAGGVVAQERAAMPESSGRYPRVEAVR
jgi:hypothetical protein